VDAGDACGRIYMRFRSAGGRKVASSNLAAPTSCCRLRVPTVPAAHGGGICALSAEVYPAYTKGHWLQRQLASL